MVGSSHEAMHRIFQKDPALLTRALQQVLHIPFPEPRDFAGMNVDTGAALITKDNVAAVAPLANEGIR